MQLYFPTKVSRTFGVTALRGEISRIGLDWEPIGVVSSSSWSCEGRYTALSNPSLAANVTQVYVTMTGPGREVIQNTIRLSSGEIIRQQFEIRILPAPESITPAPHCPLLLTPTDGALTAGLSQAVTWAAAPFATLYSVYLNDALVATTTNTGYTFTGLIPGTEYSWTVIPDGESGGPDSCPPNTFETPPLQCPVISSPTDGATFHEGSVTVTWASVTNALTYRVYFWLDGDLPELLEETAGLSVDISGLTDGDYHVKVTAVNGTESSGCGDTEFTIELPYVCGLPAAGSYLISPAWDLSYPAGNTVDHPLTIDIFSGEIVMGASQMAAGIGDGGGHDTVPPEAITLTLDYTAWTHLGQPLADPSSVDVNIQPPHDPETGVWSYLIWSSGPGDPRALRRLVVSITPVQFFPTRLWLGTRQGYSSDGFSSWYSTGWVNESGYIGDFSGLSPIVYRGATPNGDALPFYAAKYWDGNVYAISGVTDNPGFTLYRWSAPDGVLTPSGTAYSGEDLYPAVAAQRTFSTSPVADIAWDNGRLFVMQYYTPSSPDELTITEVNPLTLATIKTWTKAQDFFGLHGFTVRNERIVVASKQGGSGAQFYYVIDLNANGTMTIVHTGFHEVDPSDNQSGAYVWADPLCGWLKQKSRWISPVVGP